MMKTKPAKDEISIDVLSANDTLMLVLRLPTTVDQEIEGMVTLQAEELSPYPPDKTCMAWEKLREQDGSSCVLLAICSLQKLERFRTKKHDPARIDIDLLAIGNLLRQQGHISETAANLVLLLIADDLHMVILDKGVPCLLRSLPQGRNLTAEDLQDEVGLAVVSLGTAAPDLQQHTAQIWHDGEAPEWASALAQQQHADCHNLDELPPLEEGLQARYAQGDRLDLTPPQWREETRRRKTRRKATFTLVGVALLWLLIMLVAFLYIEVAESQLEQLQADNAQQGQRVQVATALDAKVTSLSAFMDEGGRALRTLQLISTSIPGSGDLSLRDLRFKNEDMVSCHGGINAGVTAFDQFVENLSAHDEIDVLRFDVRDTSKGPAFHVDFRWAHWPSTEEGQP